jgi:hypothetical protein
METSIRKMFLLAGVFFVLLIIVSQIVRALFRRSLPEEDLG